MEARLTIYFAELFGIGRKDLLYGAGRDPNHAEPVQCPSLQVFFQRLNELQPEVFVYELLRFLFEPDLLKPLY